jgi:hypothetical protein
LPGKWAAGLVTNLLLIVTHSQWIHQCLVLLHKGNAQGPKLKDVRELMTAIEAQFLLGLDGLYAHNRHHYISRSQACILVYPAAANKKAWLSGVRLARESYLESEARESNSMCMLMLHWLYSTKSHVFLSWSSRLIGPSQCTPLG